MQPNEASAPMRSTFAHAALVALALLLSVVTTLADVVDNPASGLPRLTSDEPFALISVRAPQGALADIWQLALADIDSDLAILSDCRARPDRCLSPVAGRFLNIVERARPYEGFAKLAMINSGVNAAILRDAVQRAGVAESWPTALATFSAGRGVCMHFAIAKYTALLLGGWPANDIRLVIVWPDRAERPHMVLAARHSGHWYLLDNLRSAVVIDGKATNYIPLFVFDYRGARELGRAESVDTPLHSRDVRMNAHVAPAIRLEAVGVH
jgi:predicted transglutaminase-like cysteine proteinase